MSDGERICDCRGDFSRRNLLKIAMGTAGLAISARGQQPGAGFIPPEATQRPPQSWFDQLLTSHAPIVYSGDQLAALIFPIGGVGTGTLWLHGSGRLLNWQIFNNIRKDSQVDDTFFAVRIERDGERPIVRILEKEGTRSPLRGAFPGFKQVEFIGRYPVGTVRFHDPQLPVDFELEGMNPLIPLNAEDSAIPCGIFTLSVINHSDRPVRISFMGSLQNAVGHSGAGSSQGVLCPTYGNNINQLVREGSMTAVAMKALPGSPAELSPPIDLMADRQVPMLEEIPVRGLSIMSPGQPPSSAATTTVYWLADGDLRRIGASILGEVADAVHERGACLLLSGEKNPLTGPIKASAPAGEIRRETVFATFDRKNTMTRWEAKRAALRDNPKSGRVGSQNPVSGFIGPGLLNSFNPDDGPQGSLTSVAFTVGERYIAFLLGGGNHPERCCINLEIDGKVVRTQTGKNTEQLERYEWDVAEFIGREARIVIADWESGGWGHVLVDDIRLSNLPIDAITELDAQKWNVLAARLEGAGDAKPVGTGKGRLMRTVRDLTIVTPGEDRARRRDELFRELAQMAKAEYQPAAGRPLDAPSFGTMCLATPEPEVSADIKWTDIDSLHQEFLSKGHLGSVPRLEDVEGFQKIQTEPTQAGQTVNAALCVSRQVAAGSTTRATFVLAWHFPHQYYPQNNWRAANNAATPVGNMYANWFHDALHVAKDVVIRIADLRSKTYAFRDAVFDTTLPQYLVDAAVANLSIVRSPTCFWTADGTFYGFEGCHWEGGGCCPMNCNHVWNYEQALAKVFPSLERDMRKTELRYHQRDDGGVHHRVEVPRDRPQKQHIVVADGQCGAVLKAYREHLQSGDRRFLDEYWPRVKKAMDFAISEWDKDNDGVMEQPQFNTYDRPIFGMNSFISSLYLAALRAAEEMGVLVRDEPAAKRYRRLFESGRDKMAAELFDGEYYIQKAENINLGYGEGCWSDQVVGQWWARVLGLGDILPNEQVQSALKSVFKYCWLWQIDGFVGTQRFLQFADGRDKGLLCGSWPKGGRPDDPILYRDECWTGVEYQVAAHKIYEGQIEEALTIVKGARERYAGDKKSPWNEIECGDYYVRAMSSWSLLLAAQGYLYDGPARSLHLNPVIATDNHRSFISFAQGWGVFEQQRRDKTQLVQLSLLGGRLDIRRLRLGLPSGADAALGTVRIDDREYFADIRWDNTAAVVDLNSAITVREGETLTIAIEWA